MPGRRTAGRAKGHVRDWGTPGLSTPGTLLSWAPPPRVPCSQSCTCSGPGTQWHGGPRGSEPPAQDGRPSHVTHVLLLPGPPPLGSYQPDPCLQAHQALQPLGHDGSKPALPRQLRNEEDVLRRRDLVGAVGPAWRQKGCLGTRWASLARWPGAGAGLTKLLDGSVSAPGQLQRHVHPAPLVLDAAVSLEGDTGAGGL